VRISQWTRSHRVSVVSLLSFMVIAGIFAVKRLPVALFPNVHFPRLMVNVDAGDRPADQMTIEVTIPVEEAIRAVAGVRSVRSTSSRGSCDVSVNFDWGTDMVAAMLQVESAVNRISGSLPPGTSFEVQVMNPTVFPSLAYSLTSDRQSLVQLTDIAYYELRPLVATVPGVSKVTVQGGRDAEFQVMVDPGRLEAHGLTVGDVANELSSANTIDAVGRIEDHDKLYLAIVDDRFASKEQIEETVLQQRPSGIVRVRDIGVVSTSVAPQWTRVTADGHDAVFLQVYQQPDGNTVQIASDVRSKLAAYRPHLPGDVKMANWYDQSQLILAAESNVRDAVLIGICLAGAVLFLFLRNGKVTLIAMACVPAVLVGTVLVLYLLGESLNIMTLGGLAAAVGLIIDDAIVMVEHIVRRLRERMPTGVPAPVAGGQNPRIWDAAAEFSQPLVASSLSTVVIFAPLAFLSGVTGAFFRALSLAMGASLIISFLIAWLVVPILASRFLGNGDAQSDEGGRFTTSVHSRYSAFMHSILKRPALVFLGIIPLLIVAWLGYRNVGTGFMPAMDEGGFIIDYRSAAGTSLTETDRLLRQVEKIVQNTPETQTYSRRTGLQLGAASVTEANEGDIFVRLRPPPRRDIDEVMASVRDRIQRTVPGLDIDMSQLMEDMIGDLTAVPQPIEVKLYSEDGKLLERAADAVFGILSHTNGVVDVTNGIVLAGDAITIRVDRAKAGLEGMDPEEVTSAVNVLLDGVLATTKVQQAPKFIGVRAWIPERFRRNTDDIANLRLRAPDGHFFPLRRVAAITTDSGQPQIEREDLKRLATVTARISGRDLGSTSQDLHSALEKNGALPPGVSYALGGTYAEQRSAFAGLMAVFGSAVALVFILLLFLYESVATAIAMLATTLLALSAVMLGLWVTRTDLNISSMMGMTMIVGIATEVAIFYVSELESLPADLPRSDSYVRAGLNRMRPIAMTTFAAILALLPLALGIGAGSAMQRPLAISIISGLLLQLPLVLVVLPAFLALRPLRKGSA
jgi:CzcA family heavy metal efflux pump